MDDVVSSSLPPTPAPAPAPAQYAVVAEKAPDGGSLLTSPAFMAAILTCCTLLAVLLWVALAVQTKRLNRARARAAQDAAARRAAMAVPVIVIQPDESIDFGAKLFRTPSGSMRPIEFLRVTAPAQQQPDQQQEQQQQQQEQQQQPSQTASGQAPDPAAVPPPQAGPAPAAA
ncbi:hypothetical protein ABPG75_011332 [Micractinium tetrahymenae]